MSDLHVGIDVSRGQLDIAQSDGAWFSVANDQAGHRELCDRWELDAPALIVMEATGGLERALAVELAAPAGRDAGHGA